MGVQKKSLKSHYLRALRSQFQKDLLSLFKLRRGIKSILVTRRNYLISLHKLIPERVSQDLNKSERERTLMPVEKRVLHLKKGQRNQVVLKLKTRIWRTKC